jgi:hypothetical protein
MSLVAPLTLVGVAAATAGTYAIGGTGAALLVFGGIAFLIAGLVAIVNVR